MDITNGPPWDEAVRDEKAAKTERSLSYEPTSLGKQRIHILKTDPEPFSMNWSGRRFAEIRLDDRHYAPGDTLILRETTHTGEEIAAGADLVYTDRVLLVQVTHVQRGYGIDPKWVVLSFTCDLNKSQSMIHYLIAKHEASQPKKLEPFQQRLVDELLELRQRLTKLTQYLASSAFKTINIVDQGDLLSQKESMIQLESILARRVKRLIPSGSVASI